jgi:hypothetical protein
MKMTNGGALIGVTYTSHAQSCDSPAVMFLVAHNEVGQAVYISTATVLVSAGEDVTAYQFVFGFPSGTTFNSTIWMVSSPSFVAITSSTTFVFTTF